MNTHDNTTGYGSIESSSHRRASAIFDDDDESPAAPGEETTTTRHTQSMLRALLGIALLSLLYYAAPTLVLGRNNREMNVIIPVGIPTVSDVVAAEGAPPQRWYNEQQVDHFDASNEKRYPQRYFEHTKHFGGPGNPIFLIVAGEDELDDLLYPFVWNDLARLYKGYTVALEHRFYGASLPVTLEPLPSNDQLKQLLSPDQALEDAVQFIQYKREQLGCHPSRGHANYCPVISVGGSYPGFLAGLLRTNYPNVIDIGYASSAPFALYDHTSSADAYFDKITAAAEAAVPGCAQAVRTTLETMQAQATALVDEGDSSVQDVAERLGICTETLPAYIMDSVDMLLEETNMVLGEKFSEANMGYYPPGPEQDLQKGCRLFLDKDLPAFAKVQQFLHLAEIFDDEHPNNEGTAPSPCFDFQDEIPPGPNGQVSSSDWSGTGGGVAGFSWDYQCCTLVPECSFSADSMFLTREWTLEWLADHCERRFDYTPSPTRLVERLGFDDWSDNVTRLLLTNGLQDGWSANSILTPPNNENIEVINFGNGAHHSDLNHYGPNEYDTVDFIEGYQAIRDLMGKWLQEVRA